MKPLLTLDQFGELVQIDKAVLTDFFELYLFTNFTDEMNRLRIQFAKHLIKKRFEENVCLDNLHMDSGFDCQADFIYFFVEFEGVSVDEYLTSLNNNK